ncbi:hypothetical protein LJC34_03110 [Oscillospiraceae bacterium OttesenSCG-928-G22]|nr:hypothetical protein [Oscillospiraceae bacterium OttesenSCG-928-G22]
MGEFEDKLNRLLSSPEEMEKVMQMARSLSGGEDAETPPPSAPTPVSTEDSERENAGEVLSNILAPSTAAEAFSSPDALSSAFGALDPKVMQTMMRVVKEYSSDDSRIQLLAALKPHLKETRGERIDKAAQLLRLTKTIRAALDIFSGGDSLV